MSTRSIAARPYRSRPPAPPSSRAAGSFHGLGAQRPNSERLTFEPGERTDWHVFPQAMTLLVVEGRGELQRPGHPPQPLLPGDVIWLDPGQRHRHGADEGNSLTLIVLDHARSKASRER